METRSGKRSGGLLLTRTLIGWALFPRAFPEFKPACSTDYRQSSYRQAHARHAWSVANISQLHNELRVMGQGKDRRLNVLAVRCESWDTVFYQGFFPCARPAAEMKVYNNCAACLESLFHLKSRDRQQYSRLFFSAQGDRWQSVNMCLSVARKGRQPPRLSRA